jgi:hypothetical protein
MATVSPDKRRIAIRLLHDGAQPGAPLDEPLRFGLQDRKGEVHPGERAAEGVLRFDFSLDVKESGDPKSPAFSGAFVHGPPSGRFLYLSWKRERASDAPWGWRIKIPLSGIGWADIRAAGTSGRPLKANVAGRRPHASEAIDWRLGEQG